ncbi:MAG: SH3 domain-containing protein [Planctomycetota bacterium]
MIQFAAAIYLSVISIFTGAADTANAEKLYRAGRYDLALLEYEKEINGNANPEAPVLYNAGNCAYRLEKYPQAALYYKRALKREPRDAQTEFNLRLAQKRLAMAPPAPEDFITTVRRFIENRSASELLITASLLEAGGLLVIIFLRKRRAGVVAGIVILAAAGACGYVYIQKVYGEPKTEGLVLASEVKIFSEPRDDLPVLLTLKAGEAVAIEEASDRWVRVRYENRRGWTPRAGIGIVD